MQSKTVRSSITAAVSNIIGSQKTKQWGLTWINIGFSCYLATRVLFTWKSWQNLESFIFCVLVLQSRFHVLFSSENCWLEMTAMYIDCPVHWLLQDLDSTGEYEDWLTAFNIEIYLIIVYIVYIYLVGTLRLGIWSLNLLTLWLRTVG